MEIINELEYSNFDNNQVDYLLSIFNDLNNRIDVEDNQTTIQSDNNNYLPF